MNKTCTQEFLDLKNPVIIKTILENLNKSALILFLQQRGFCVDSLKRMSKTKLIDEVIKTFDLPTPGCNTAKQDFYNTVIKQKPGASFCLSNTDRALIQELVNTTDVQKRYDIVNMLDANTLYMLSSYFDIQDAEKMDIQELRKIFIRLSSKGKTPSPQTCGYSTPPLISGFLNARTIADRREILKNLNKQQLSVLATYFKLSDYKTQTRENIMKKLLYNIPPPNVTSARTDKVSLTQRIIDGFRNAQTVATRKEYLNTLDKKSLFVLAEHYEIPNYENKNKEEIFNDLVYRVPPTLTVSTASSSCNIPKNIQFFSEREKKIVKSFINATTISSKKKLLNSLSKEDLMILAQKFNIYGAASLNTAQLREQIFKNGTNSGTSIIQMFELAQNEEQRKRVLNFADKRGLMMLAKKYNIININKMPAENIRKALVGLPYMNHKLSSCSNVCENSYYAMPSITRYKQAIISSSPTRTSSPSSPSISVLKNLPPPLSPNDKILTPSRNRGCNDMSTSCSPQRSFYSTSEWQKSIDQDLSQSESSFQQRLPSCVSKPPRKMIKTVPTSFTKTPLKVKSVEDQTCISPQPSGRSTSSMYTSPQPSGRSTPISYKLTSSKIASLVGPGSTEVNRNSSCSLEETHHPSVEISNLSNSPQKNLSGLHNILDNLQTRFGQTREKAIQNRDLIKFTIKNYLENNPLYTDDGELITVDNNSFFSNGILLLGDGGEQKKQVEELKRRVPYINWSAISGIVGVGLVHLYSWWLYNMVGDVFGPSNTGFNLTNEYGPQPIQPQTLGFNYYSDECGGYNTCPQETQPNLYNII